MDLATLIANAQALTPFEARQLEAVLALGRLNMADYERIRVLMDLPQGTLGECAKKLAERAEQFANDMEFAAGSAMDVGAIAGTLGAWLDCGDEEDDEEEVDEEDLS